jgi:type I restriction enzyme, S subunit
VEVLAMSKNSIYDDVALGNVTKFSQGKQIPITEQFTEPDDGLVRFIRISDITQSTDDKRYVKDPGEKFHINSDDLLMVRYGETAGTIGRGFTGIPANNLFTITPTHKELSKKFLYYVLKQDYYYKWLYAQRAAAAMPAITFETVSKLEFPLPPYNIQRKIADILSAYDDLIEVNTRRIRVLEAMAQSVYREWFWNVDAKSLPRGWEMVTVREVSSYINRGVSPKYDDSSTSIVINQKCIRNEQLNLSLARRHITKVPVEKYVKFGDVLVNSTGIGTLGRIAQVYQEVTDCCVDSHVSIVRPNDRVSVDYFGFYLLTLQPLFDSLGVGSTGQTELSRDTIANADFVLPPKKLQEKFTEFVLPLRKQVILLTEQNANLRRTRDLLLPRLVSGEISIEGLKTKGD